MSETTIYMTHRVPGASLDLTIPVQLLVNVSDEVIAHNVSVNSRRRGRSPYGRIPRIKTTPAHDGVAIMCGSGPSLADHIDMVGELQAKGGHVFGLNGAARFVDGHGIKPDFQVLVDARERTSELIGPAKTHLFASQCDPVCFDIVPEAVMWHFINGELDQHLPEDEESHAQIGGAGSVGNCALALAWAMGYRHFEVFGYDSSHRNNAGHAFHQPLNDFEPWGRFQFNGKEYIASYTMRSQASRFQVIGRELLKNGCILNVHGDGLLQDMWRTPLSALSEKEKYQRMWDEPDYRDFAPGEHAAGTFLAMINKNASVIDFGCGTGRGALQIANAGHQITLLDFAHNCRDDAAKGLPFHLADLTQPIHHSADVGYCTDVMEHIPTNDVALVVGNIMGAVPECFFQISTRPDRFGAAIGQALHLTVQPHGWWRTLFESHGYAVTFEHKGEHDSQFMVKRTV